MPTLRALHLIPAMVVLAGASFAQVSVDSLEKVFSNATIPVEDLLGKWISVDSFKVTIEFVDNTFEVVMDPRVHVDNYRFKKHFDKIEAKGGAANWPPYTCVINLLEKNNLEMYFYICYDEKANKVNFVKM